MLKKFDKQINEVKTVADLRRHAAVGKMCGCGDCFCCAAKAALDRYTKDAETLAKLFAEHETISLQSGVKLGDLLDKAHRIVLELCVEKQVRFVAPLAVRRLKTLNNYPRAYCYNEALRMMGAA